MNMEAAFNGQRVLEVLSKMNAHQQLAFGAACCERMLPSYELFMDESGWGNVEPLRGALDAIWGVCQQASSQETKWQNLLTQCEQCVPDSEEFDSLYTSAAQDTTFAICTLLEFLLDGNSDHVVDVPRFSTDSVDLIVQERENMDPGDPSREHKILEHPLMQQELARQRRDLAQALSFSPGDSAAVVAFRTQISGESNLTLKF